MLAKKTSPSTKTHLSLLLRALCLCALLVYIPARDISAEGRLKLNDVVNDFQIKGLFLYNFANFVIWPDQAFSGTNGQLKLCLVGDIPQGGFLDTVDGTLIRKRTLSVIRAQDAQDPAINSGCHILFVGFDQEQELKHFFANLNHTFVLSVGDEPQFADNWGTINIHRVKDGAKVEINLKKVLENQLTVSSDLLAIAKVIR